MVTTTGTMLKPLGNLIERKITMDLHNFSGESMYFDEALSPQVKALIEEASDGYSQGEAEAPLLKAFYLAPESLSVLVALYRYYYYQHRYSDALKAAEYAMNTIARQLKFPESWRDLSIEFIGFGVMQSMTLVRFYLMTLKGSGYLYLRLDELDEGIERLEKVLEVDTEDRLGASVLLQTVESYQRRKEANFGKLQVVA